MMNKTFCSLALLLATLPLATAQASGTGQRPNIIYILADDLGIGDVTAMNPESRIPTPLIDRIAREGMTFTDAHTGSAVCTPTRYGILTGRYAWRTSLKNGVLQGYSLPLINPGRQTAASYLHSKGYHTACIGKWHLGMGMVVTDGKKPDHRFGSNVDLSVPVDSGPLDLGFDYFFGITASLNMSPHAFIRNREPVNPLSWTDDEKTVRELGLNGFIGWYDPEYKQDEVLAGLAADAVDWISRQGEEPFFLYLPLTAPHAPIVPGDDFRGKSPLGPYGDYCLEVDWAVGEILSVLDRKGLSDNTLIIFTSDNGCSPMADFSELQSMGHYPSYIYRGLKGSLYEGGHRVPFLVRWPGVVKEGSTGSATICTTDLLATLYDIFGEDMDANTGEDSYSFLGQLTGREPEWAGTRGIVHHSDNGYFSIRKGKWKLILHEGGGTRRNNPKDPPVVNPAAIQLFDLDADPSESTNVQHLYPDIVLQLKKSLAAYIRSGRSTPGPDVPFYMDKNWKQLDLLKDILDFLN